jgi:hypothetical protein
LSVLAERRLRAAAPSDLASLLEDLAHPPIDRIGALAIDKFLPKRERAAWPRRSTHCLRRRRLRRGAPELSWM